MKCRLIGASIIAFGIAATASAQSWPTKPVRIINPFPAGGGTDTFARPLSVKLTQALGQQFLIENQGGAGGTVGATNASRATPDGYTMFIGAVHHTIAESLYTKLPYSLERDFIPITVIAYVPNVIAIHPKNDFKSLKELIDFARANAGKLNYGSAGNGTSHHLAGELFKLQTNTFITHIPYRGAGPALQDLVSGQVDMMFDGLGSSAGHIRGGRLRGIAVAADKRAVAFPDMPTAAESGVSTYKVSTWYGIWAPKGTPAEATNAMAAEMRKALNSEELKTMWVGLGTETPNLWGADFGRFVSAEVKRWADVVKSSGAKLD